jgi:hypothetical protein
MNVRKRGISGERHIQLDISVLKTYPAGKYQYHKYPLLLRWIILFSGADASEKSMIRTKIRLWSLPSSTTYILYYKDIALSPPLAVTPVTEGSAACSIGSCPDAV